jgi:hypothetical protein
MLNFDQRAACRVVSSEVVADQLWTSSILRTSSDLLVYLEPRGLGQVK